MGKPQLAPDLPPDIDTPACWNSGKQMQLEPTLSKGRAGPGPTHFSWPLTLALEGRVTLSWPWPGVTLTRGQ